MKRSTIWPILAVAALVMAMLLIVFAVVNDHASSNHAVDRAKARAARAEAQARVAISNTAQVAQEAEVAIAQISQQAALNALGIVILRAQLEEQGRTPLVSAAPAPKTVVVPVPVPSGKNPPGKRK